MIGIQEIRLEMLEMQGIRVEMLRMRKIRVEMQGKGVGMRGIENVNLSTRGK